MDVRTGFQVAPGSCFSCGTSDQSKVVTDWGDHPQAVRRLRIYLCDECVTAGAQGVAKYKGLPWVPVSEVAALQAQLLELDGLRARAEAAEARLADIADWIKASGALEGVEGVPS